MREGVRDRGGETTVGGTASRPEEHLSYVKYSTACLFFSCIKQEKFARAAPRHKLRVCSDPSVAMLVLLAGAAGARGVARGAGVDAGSRGGRGRSHRHRAGTEPTGGCHHPPAARTGGVGALHQGGILAAFVHLVL